MTETNPPEILKQYSTQVSVFTNYAHNGVEYWHCKFTSKNHPVNRKLFKISGAEQE